MPSAKKAASTLRRAVRKAVTDHPQPPAMNQKNRNKQPPRKSLPPEPSIPELYQIVVHCTDEADQRNLYERLAAENRKCRLIIL
mgnify:CR=1 FL=1